MHDHFTVISNDGILQHTRTVIAANTRDAWLTHQQHYPACTVLDVWPEQRRP